MPKRKRSLSASEVRKLTRPGLHAVGGCTGLCLQAGRNGTRSWVLRYSAGNRVRHLGLGSCSDVSLKRAREQAREYRDAIRAGRDPVQERRQAKQAQAAARATTMSFAEATRQCHEKKAPEFRSDRYRDDWFRSLKNHAFPMLGSMDVAAVELGHVLRVLEPLWQDKTPTAVAVRQRIETVLDWATVRGFRRGENPARWRGHLDQLLANPSRSHTVVHHAALPWPDAPAFMAGLQQQQGIAAKALQFVLYTAARSGEVRGATWREIDADTRLWTVPAVRMKAARDHVVPLPEAALALLQTLPGNDGSGLLFPNQQGQPLSDVALGNVIKRMGYAVTVHGFRSTFSDWCSEVTTYPAEVREMALAHSIPSAVERAYRRGDLLAKRRRLMQEWAHHLRQGTAGATITPIRQAASTAR